VVDESSSLMAKAPSPSFRDDRRFRAGPEVPGFVGQRDRAPDGPGPKDGSAQWRPRAEAADLGKIIAVVKRGPQALDSLQ
jgi:hypothetical protein